MTSDGADPPGARWSQLETLFHRALAVTPGRREEFVNAACAEDVTGGDYIGPDGLGEMRGGPRKVNSSLLSHSASTARQTSST